MQEKQIPGVVAQVEKLLSSLSRQRNIGLGLEKQDYRLEDGWLYLCVTSNKPDVRVSDYAELLADVEKELRTHKINNVLLVPTVAD